MASFYLHDEGRWTRFFFLKSRRNLPLELFGEFRNDVIAAPASASTILPWLKRKDLANAREAHGEVQRVISMAVLNGARPLCTKQYACIYCFGLSSNLRHHKEKRANHTPSGEPTDKLFIASNRFS